MKELAKRSAAAADYGRRAAQLKEVLEDVITPLLKASRKKTDELQELYKELTKSHAENTAAAKHAVQTGKYQMYKRKEDLHAVVSAVVAFAGYAEQELRQDLPPEVMVCGDQLTAQLRKLPPVAAEPGPQPVVQPTPELELARVKEACSFSLRVLVSAAKGVGVDWDVTALPTPHEDAEGDAEQDGKEKGGAGKGGTGKGGEGEGGAGNGGVGKGGEEKDGSGQGGAGLGAGHSGAVGSTGFVPATAEDVLGHAWAILD